MIRTIIISIIISVRWMDKYLLYRTACELKLHVLIDLASLLQEKKNIQ